MKLDSISNCIGSFGATVKGAAKLLVLSRRPTVSKSGGGERLVVLGNGPSLRETIARSGDALKASRLMAVNFMANTPEFFALRPEYYILADPHFFAPAGTDPNVDRFWENIARVDWPITLFVPAREAKRIPRVEGENIKVERFNPVGFEGYDWAKNLAYASGRGMPRPRNVLIAAIMVGIQAGFRDIVIVGADHSWPRTLSVNDENEVVSIQPHFYEDNSKEKERVTATYKNIRLHEIMLSFHVAFKAYHEIARYASRRGVKIMNATPGSFIDAFPRGELK